MARPPAWSAGARAGSAGGERRPTCRTGGLRQTPSPRRPVHGMAGAPPPRGCEWAAGPGALHSPRDAPLPGGPGVRTRSRGRRGVGGGGSGRHRRSCRGSHTGPWNSPTPAGTRGPWTRLQPQAAGATVTGLLRGHGPARAATEPLPASPEPRCPPRAGRRPAAPPSRGRPPSSFSTGFD